MKRANRLDASNDRSFATRRPRTEIRNPTHRHAADGKQEPLGGVVTFGAQGLREGSGEAHFRDRIGEPLNLALNALLARTVRIDLVGSLRKLGRTVQRFLFDPCQQLRRGQRATHVVEHDAIDLGMISDHVPAYRGPAVLVRNGSTGTVTRIDR